MKVTLVKKRLYNNKEEREGVGERVGRWGGRLDCKRTILHTDKPGHLTALFAFIKYSTTGDFKE